jgi:ferredoxin
MASFKHRYPLNVVGRFYIDDQCTDCDLCRECAPHNIRRDDRLGHSYVFRQPETEEEIAACMEGVHGCPTDAVGDDGDRYDWKITPIVDWNTISRLYGDETVEFDLTSPVIPYSEPLPEDTPKTGDAVSATQLSPLLWQRIRRIFGPKEP